MKILKKNQKNIQKEIGNIFGNQNRSKFSKNIYTNLDSSPNKFGKTENQRFGDSNKKPFSKLEVSRSKSAYEKLRTISNPYVLT